MGDVLTAEVDKHVQYAALGRVMLGVTVSLFGVGMCVQGEWTRGGGGQTPLRSSAWRRRDGHLLEIGRAVHARSE